MLKYKIEDYIGKKYGHLKVLGKAIESNVPNCFLFLCDCGREISLAPDLVIKGYQKSCGKCLFSNESPARIKPEDYIGKRNNLLTVVSTHKEPKGRTKLICLCDCGKTTEVLPYQFKKGSIKSCGCLLKNSPNYLDGRSANELYGLWKTCLEDAKIQITQNFTGMALEESKCAMNGIIFGVLFRGLFLSEEDQMAFP